MSPIANHVHGSPKTYIPTKLQRLINSFLVLAQRAGRETNGE